MPAFAQGNPSANQIINSLLPKGNLTQGGTRGIRLAAPSGSATAPTQAPSAATSQSPAAIAAPVPAAPARTAHQAPTHAATQAATQSPTQAAPSVNLTVDFATNSATLTPQAIKTLDELGKALSSQQLASYHFRIEGHTDTVGTPDYNKALSQRRADAVAAYLEHTYNIHASRLQPLGLGEEGLLVPTPPQTAEQRNRRVEVVNLGA
ncbi:MAG: OmpA family protein [Acetobacteraceae bacterium]